MLSLTPTNIIELIVMVIIIVYAVDGWRRGLLFKVYSLVRFILMVVMTVILTPIVYSIMPLNAGLREGASVIVALIIVNIVLGLIAGVLGIVDKIPVIHTLNRLGGAIVGLILGVMSIWLVLLIISYFTDIEWCQNVITYVSESPILSRLVSLSFTAATPSSLE